LFGYSQGGGTGDNLDELHSNTGLTSLVVLKGQLIDDLTSVLAGILHSVHASGLLSSGVVEEGHPKVAGNVELVKGRVSSVLVRGSHFVKLTELEGIEESLSGEELKMADDGSDSGHILVVENDDLVGVITSLNDMLGDSHNSGVVVRSADLADTNLKEILEGALHADGTLISNGEDGLLCSAMLKNVVSHVSDDTRVDRAAHTLIRGQANEEFLSI